MTEDRAAALAGLGWASVAEALEGIPALVAAVSGPEHQLIYSNDAYAEAFGAGGSRRTHPRLIGRSFRSLLEDVYSSGRPCTLRAAAVHLGGDASEELTEAGSTETDDAIKPVSLAGNKAVGHFTFVCAPLRDETRRLVGVLVLAVDVTEQVRAADESRVRAGGANRATALSLQRSLLPQVLHQPDELRVAVQYRPGSDVDEVGGDWYDIVPLGAGRTGIAIGDVLDRGVRAAAVMGQLRAALRAYARLDLPPSEILELLDGLVADMDTPGIVTCCYAVFDPVEATVTCASAGHLPPFLVYGDGIVERVKLTAGAPLGAHGGAFPEQVCVLQDGAVLALYTDGVISSGDRDLEDGLRELTDALAHATGTLDERCERVLGRMSESPPDGLREDMALMLVGRRSGDGTVGPARARTIELTLSEGQEPTRRARAFCHGALSMWHVPEPKQEDIVLVVSELVTNAILHGEAAKQLRLRRTARRVVVEVFDNGRRMPHPRAADLDAESGRGLHLVSRLADRWGARPVHGGKVVWCEFDVPLPAARA